MSAAALAAPEAAPHAQPHPAAAGVRTRDGGLTIRVPLRLVVGAQYPDAALSVYVKVAALALRPEGCTARVATLAEYLGMSKSAVERGLRPLTQPDPIDGITEVPTVRRTKRGGTGDSAHRVTRQLTEDELWVRIPVRAAEALTPRLLRLYALLAYATARRIPVTAAELGEMLHHHTGKRAGEHLGERQARRLVDELEATGWLTVHRREGEQGRHAYETRRHPLRTVPAAPAEEPPAIEQLALWDEAAPVIEDGSGSDLGDGSLASKEDLGTDRPEKTQLGGGIRRRRGDRKCAADPVDNRVLAAFGSGDLVLRTDAGTDGPGPAAGRPAYTGPVLQLSPRVWRVLEPVRHHLGEIRPFVLRRIARTIGEQLDAPGGSEDRLIDRLSRRYATTEEIRDIGRWLLGAGLVRHGCGRPECETGVIWPSGEDCELCAVNRQTAAARARRDAELAAAEERMAERRRRLRALEDQAQREPATAAAARRQQSGEEPRPGPPAGTAALPPKATYRQRQAASDEEIRAAITDLGPAVALHIYGHLRTLPLLDRPNVTDETGTDRRTPHAQ
ncbi:hypothetical protein [Streptomyces sp. NBC_00557]|uniref:hypothetical protein n=1 Tax=Streptomyces sp. NBC_00557 TaxID=2975776 RepID=UPI002E8023CC|nr:hypothetical protein [Streptomyces sp. NBC_00557]WUC36357.1 hypothetical protein OG956_20110 [Streptomyces sp. NBC_00557]